MFTKNKLKEIYNFSKIPILFIILGVLECVFLFWITGYSYHRVLEFGEVWAVIVVALPTLLIWGYDIQSKSIANRTANVESFLQIQKDLEERYEKIINFFEIDNNDSDSNIDQINKIGKFLQYVEASGDMLPDKSYKFYQVDLSKIYKLLSKIENDLEEKYNNKIGDYKTKILSIVSDNFNNENLIDELNFLKEETLFRNIDFSTIPNLNYDNNESGGNSEELIFSNCTIDIDSFDIIFPNANKLTFDQCEFVQRSIIIKTKKISELPFSCDNIVIK